MTDEQKLLNSAKAVLEKNDRGGWTVPAGDLYPHQWFWDSCFIAIGLRHIDINRAKTEIRSLLRGQWQNGMIPNVIFNAERLTEREFGQWQSHINPNAPAQPTTGITQPPMLAEAVVKIGEKLNPTERHQWYRQIFPALLRHHEWLYRERDPHQEGLIVLLHPYECGLDNTPPWIKEMRMHNLPLWIRLVEKFHLDWVANFIRTDTRHVSPRQRMSNIDAMSMWAAVRRLRRKKYDSEAILDHALFAVEDLAFNCIFIRANQQLRTIAKAINHNLPEELLERMRKTESALETLWDETDKQYYSRSFVTHKLIKEPTIATLLPLYTGGIEAKRINHLVKLLNNPKWFGMRWPVPSVPKTSSYFNPLRYWQGPTWLNTNWLIIEGLQRNRFTKQAEQLSKSSVAMVGKSGIFEYYNPQTAEGAGAKDFSWTAALTIDLLSSD